MSFTLFLYIAAAAIFCIALIAGLLPITVMRHHEKALALGDAWASGIFLGAALFHMLPDAERGFQAALPQVHYPLAALACMFGFLLLLFIERLVIEIAHPDYQDQPKVTGLILFSVLSIHALIEGAAIGINTVFADAFAIFIAVIAHKGSASFALAINLRQTSLSRKFNFILLLLFSLMTPSAIIFASFLNKALQSHTAELAQAGFNAFAAGTFLYIGMRHIMEKQFAEYEHIGRLAELTAIVIGMIFMSIVAIWT